MSGLNQPAPAAPAPAAPAPASPPAPAPAAPAPAAPAPAPAAPAPAAPQPGAVPPPAPPTFAGKTAAEHKDAASFAGVTPGTHETANAPQPVNPATYTDFTLPAHIDGTTESAKHVLELFKHGAGKRGMTQEHAQATLDLMHEVEGGAEQLNKSLLAQQNEHWHQESQQKGLLTQEVATSASAGLMALDPKGELRTFLANNGLSYHPALIQAFAAFHTRGGKPAALTGGLGGNQPTQGGPRDLKDIMYPQGGRT